MTHRLTMATLAAAIALATGPALAGSAEDTALTAKVKSALLTSADTEALSIDVESKDGIVQLNGFVETPAARTAAAKVTAGVEGVTRVDNNLAIQGAKRSTETVVDDAAITAQVKAAVIGDPITKGHEINVDTNAGVVQLNGFVASDAERQRADQLARSIDGVAIVKNNLVVRR